MAHDQTAKSAYQAPQSPAAATKPQRRSPGWVGRIVIALALLAAVVIRVWGPLDGAPYPISDAAFRNIFTAVLLFIAGVTLFLWFCFRSSYPPLVRLLTLVSLPALAGLFLLLFRPTGANGNFEWSFEPRWQPVADRQLGKLEVPATPANASVPAATSSDEDFPQFLGPSRSGYLPGPELARDWTKQPPKLLWKRPIGAGWSGFAAVGGRAYTLEQRGDDEWISCYELATGKPLWGYSVRARHEDVVGGIGPGSTPTIHQGRVYAQGGTGIVSCLDATTGELLWQDDLLARYGLTQAESKALIAWGRAGSPLVVDDLVVVPAGGPEGKQKSLIAYKAETGEVAWQVGSDQVSYASPGLMTIAGVRQIVIVSQGRVTAHDPASGQELWNHPWPGMSNSNASASQAVPIGENRLLLSKGYGHGSELLPFEPAAGGGLTKLPSVWVNHRVLQTKFTNVTVIGEHVYALSDGILECVELATGKRVWKKGRYGHGQVLGVGQLILVLGEEGEVYLVEANPEKHVELGRFQAIEGKTWNNPCLTGHTLLVRNAEEAAAYQLP